MTPDPTPRSSTTAAGVRPATGARMTPAPVAPRYLSVSRSMPHQGVWVRPGPLPAPRGGDLGSLWAALDFLADLR